MDNLDIGFIRWEIEQKEKEFQNFMAPRLEQLHDYLVPKVPNHIVLQAIPTTKMERFW